METKQTVPFRTLAVGVWLALMPVLTGGAGAEEESSLAQQLLRQAGVTGGLIVHVGCGNGTLTAALAAAGPFVVQGLAADPAQVAAARTHLRALGQYGRVTVERLREARLPYAENMVNLVVVSAPEKVPEDELKRVLTPGGAALVQQGHVWKKIVKPKADNTDEWTHYLHDASGNPVAHDLVVAPPQRVQWAEGPRYSRSHEHTASVSAVVSSGGRIFYVVDEAPTWSILCPPRWRLVARDAYNGVRLWDRPVTAWWPRLAGWTSNPPQLHRRLVAVGDRVYATLGWFAPVTALDAATGRTLKTYPGTEGTEEIVWVDGVLLLVRRQVTERRKQELGKWRKLAREPKSPLYTRDTEAPLIKELRQGEWNAAPTVSAVDADTGRVLWQRSGDQVTGFRPLSLCALDSRVFYQHQRQVQCLALRTGKPLWSVPAPRLKEVCPQGVVCADKSAVVLLGLDTGEPRWNEKPTLCSIRDAFVIDGALWLGGFRPYQGRKKGRRGPAWGPYFVTQRDLATGKLVKEIDEENPGHHHRCYLNKATDRYILGGRRGTEFINLKTGEVRWHSWARGVCRYGIMACNGLLYVPPDACGCYVTTKLTGFYALAGAPPASQRRSAPPADPLTKGPAFALPGPPGTTESAGADWPTYRHDPQRSGFFPGPLPAALRPAWQTPVGGKLTSLTVAGGKVFVASPDQQRVCALDVRSGRLVWEFTPGARVDSPPTVWRDRALFGCRDGAVYCVRTSDGALAWRRQVARENRLLVIDGQLESVSPVPGSVLLRTQAPGPTVYVTAGRSSYLDGGIDLCRLDPRNGKLLSRTSLTSPDPKTGVAPKQYGPNAMPGALADILVSDDRYVYLRDQVFGVRGERQPKGNAHLLTLTGFLDDNWPHRSYWIFGTHCSLSTGCSGRERNLLYGRLIAFNGSMIYGYGRQTVHWSNQLEDGRYRLFAVGRNDRKERWRKVLPFQVRGLVLTGNALVVAGPAADPRDLAFRPEKKRKGLLLALSPTDGAELSRCELPAPPVLDGVVAASNHLYVATTDGMVVCLGGAASGTPVPKRP